MAYLGWYGLGRAFIEGLRTDSLMLTDHIRTSQWLAGICFVAAVVILIVMRIKLRKKRDAEAEYTPQFAEASEALEERTIDVALSEETEEAAEGEKSGGIQPPEEAGKEEIPAEKKEEQ